MSRERHSTSRLASVPQTQRSLGLTQAWAVRRQSLMVAELYVKIEHQVRDCREKARRTRTSKLCPTWQTGTIRSKRHWIHCLYIRHQLCNTAHPVTTEVPPGYDGMMSWFKYSDAVEEWCDLTKAETRRREPAIAGWLSGRAELFKERLDRERLRDPETGVEYFLATCDHFSSRIFNLCFFIHFSRDCTATEDKPIINAGWWSTRLRDKKQWTRGLMLWYRDQSSVKQM